MIKTMYTSAIGIQPSTTISTKHRAGDKPCSSHITYTTPTSKTTALRRFFSLPKSKTEFFARLARVGVISFATLTTTPFYIGLNELLMLAGLIPPPALQKADTTVPDGEVKIDNFAKNYKGFATITEALLKAGIKDLKSFDGDDSGIALDSKKDFDTATALLEEELLSIKEKDTRELYGKVIELLREMKNLNEIIWGDNGPNPNKPFQDRDGQCEIVADLIGASLTKDNKQKLKGDLKVLALWQSPLTGKPFMDIEVTIGGEIVKVKSTDVYFQNLIRGELGPICLRDALEKVVLNQGIFSLGQMSGTTNLLTGEKYYTVPIKALSNKALEQVLTQAPPNSIIKLATYPSADDYAGYWLNNEPKSLDEYIESNNGLYRKHTYVVKGHKYENGQLKILVKDGLVYKEHKLSIEQIREDMAFISAPAETIPLLNERTITVWLLAIGVTMLVSRQIKKRNV